MTRFDRMERLILPGVTALLALTLLVQGPARERWSEPAIALGDLGYLAWPVVGLLLAASALHLLSHRNTLPEQRCIRPLAGAVLALAALGLGVGWLLSDLLLLIAAFLLLSRSYALIQRERITVGVRRHVLLATPIGLASGWVTVALFTVAGAAIWSFTGIHTGAVATAWQAAILVLMLLFIGFGIEATRAHPAFTIGALWALASVVMTAADREDTTLMIIALVVSLISVALFFIERAMFRYRAGSSRHDGR